MDQVFEKKRIEMTPEALESLGAPETVYVREITVEDLRADLIEEFGEETQITIEPGTKLYALHAANGERMAVMDSRDAAFGAALQYELTPVSVH